MSKIKSLTKEINKLHARIDALEEKNELAKDKVDAGELSKADFYKIRQEISMKIRGIQATIHRKEKARLYFEREERDRHKEIEEKIREREAARELKQREREDRVKMKQREQERKRHEVDEKVIKTEPSKSKPLAKKLSGKVKKKEINK